MSQPTTNSGSTVILGMILQRVHSPVFGLCYRVRNYAGSAVYVKYNSHAGKWVLLLHEDEYADRYSFANFQLSTLCSMIYSILSGDYGNITVLEQKRMMKVLSGLREYAEQY